MGKFFGIFTNIWTSTQESGIVLHLLQRFQMKDILGSLEYDPAVRQCQILLLQKIGKIYCIVFFVGYTKLKLL